MWVPLASVVGRALRPGRASALSLWPQNQGRMEQCRRRPGKACHEFLLGSRSCRTDGAWLGGPSALRIVRASPAASSTRFHLVTKVWGSGGGRRLGDGKGRWACLGQLQEHCCLPHRCRPWSPHETAGPACSLASRTAQRALAPPTLAPSTTAASLRSHGIACELPAPVHLALAWLVPAAAACGIPPSTIAL